MFQSGQICKFYLKISIFFRRLSSTEKNFGRPRTEIHPTPLLFICSDQPYTYAIDKQGFIGKNAMKVNTWRFNAKSRLYAGATWGSKAG